MSKGLYISRGDLPEFKRGSWIRGLPMDSLEYVAKALMLDRVMIRSLGYENIYGLPEGSGQGLYLRAVVALPDEQERQPHTEHVLEAVFDDKCDHITFQTSGAVVQFLEHQWKKGSKR